MGLSPLVRRAIFFLIADVILLSLAFWLAFGLRFDFDIPQAWMPIAMTWSLPWVASKLVALGIIGVYRYNWRFFGVREFFILANTLSILSLILLLITLTAQAIGFSSFLPRSVIVIDWLFGVAFLLALRSSKRLYHEILTRNRDGIRTLIVGLTPTAERIARELHAPTSEMLPIAFVADDPKNLGSTIAGLIVTGPTDRLGEIVRESHIEAVILADPTLTHTKISHLFQLAREGGAKIIRIVPALEEVKPGQISVKDLRDINLEDLLAREPVRIDEAGIARTLSGRRILITGAGGSIGSEIVRQLTKFSPGALIAFEIDETELHNLSLQMARLAPHIPFIPVVGDLRDEAKLQELFTLHHPEIIFHAAAYKHVPLMESFPEEAIKTNVLGTLALAKLACDHGVRTFINISTDKAVNPTSIMGATKRLAEMIGATLNRTSPTAFISVRFGNVLGSRGSVIPIFLEQIRQGGPVTLTDQRMRRYFMTIPEAVLLVFQAASMGQGGEVFVLDMGEPVLISKLAEDLIRLQGLEPGRDIKIITTGLRPGEKLFEELLTAEEGTVETTHNKVHIAKKVEFFTMEELEAIASRLSKLAKEGQRDEIRRELRNLVPFYHEEQT
ncbi:MAG: polysaccharide biosynthesis protein [Campylobacterales bacterium]